ncbi:MAG: ABC transporter substrate-binding protein [Bauldia sp.]|nr:ABC transporter substrate-binding protein [Bauldia sp.]
MAASSAIARAAAAVLALVCTLAPAGAQAPAAGAAPATPPVEFRIGYVELADDPRYDEDYAYNLIPVRPIGRPYPGAEMGIGDALQIGQTINTNFSLVRSTGTSLDEVVAAVTGFVAEGIHFVLADLPAADLLALSDRVTGMPVTILNISAPEDYLRGESCRFNVVHVIPSSRMLIDATMQFLVFHRWRNVLVLQGPLPADQLTVDSVRQSAAFFGARIVDVRPYVLSANPRDRDQNNVALLTGGANYDVVYVADADGDYARYVAYETNDPRPVVGAAGLTALAWHWSWERQGAPQVNARFEAVAGRRMADVDFAAWAAVRGLTQSVLRSRSTEYQPVLDYLLGERLNLDGSKGYPMSVRPWDHQLRQPILLATANAVMQLAPIEGFLHQFNDLDTLGVDEPQSVCRF